MANITRRRLVDSTWKWEAVCAAACSKRFNTKEIVAILANWERMGAQLSTECVQQPLSGSLYLYNSATVRNFRSDEVDWVRSVNRGGRLNEKMAYLRVNAHIVASCMYTRSNSRPSFSRRIYALRRDAIPPPGETKSKSSPPLLNNIVLVHYFDEDRPRRTAAAPPAAPVAATRTPAAAPAPFVTMTLREMTSKINTDLNLPESDATDRSHLEQRSLEEGSASAVRNDPARSHGLRLARWKKRALARNESALLGRRVRTDYGDDGFFVGRIVRFNAAHCCAEGVAKPYFVRYDDGDEVWENPPLDDAIELLPAEETVLSLDETDVTGSAGAHDSAIASAVRSAAGLELPRRRASRFFGVTWDVHNKKWRAQTGFKGKTKFIGCYRDATAAAWAFDASVITHSLNKDLNFPNAPGAAGHETTKKVTTSRYRGVCWDRLKKKWVAKICVDGMGMSLGAYANEVDAGRAYDDGVRTYYPGARKPQGWVGFNIVATDDGGDGGEDDDDCGDDDEEEEEEERSKMRSRYVGVNWFKRRKAWVAQIKINGKQKNLGRFDSDVDGARAYDAAVAAHSLDRPVNFPGEAGAGGAKKAVKRVDSLDKSVSDFFGVHWSERYSKWWVQTKVRGKKKYIGVYDDETAAARAFDAFVITHKLHHDLNFPNAPGAAWHETTKKGASSRYRGVSKRKRNGSERWIATLFVDGKPKYLGIFILEEDAARAYDAAVRKHYPGARKPQTWTRFNFPCDGDAKTEDKEGSTGGGNASSAPVGAELAMKTEVSFLLYTVTFYANLAHSLTRSP